jgi:hypothetical protein
MTKPKPPPPTFLKGSLQRARIDAAARTAAGEDVDTGDLGGGRLADEVDVMTTIKHTPDEPSKPAD